MYSYLHDMLREAARDDDSSSGQRQMPPEVSLYNDVTLAQLLQPDMTAHAVQVSSCCCCCSGAKYHDTVMMTVHASMLN